MERGVDPTGPAPRHIRWALEGPLRGGTPARDAAPEDTDRRARERLLCARCRSPVTTRESRIEIADRHEHIHTNPHGFAYHIGCFAAAPGCVGVGRTESHWSWFPGYTWQIAICRACHAHLGWLFRAADKRLYGLILDRLIEESPDDE